MHVNISSTPNHPNSRNVNARHAKANPTASNCAHCQENWETCQFELHPITDKRYLTNKHAVRSNRKHDTLVIMNAEGTPQLAHPNLHTPTCTSTPQSMPTQPTTDLKLNLKYCLRCCRGNCVFETGPTVVLEPDKHPTVSKPRTTSTQMLQNFHRRLQHVNALTSHCPTASHYSEPLLPGGTNPASLHMQ